MAVGIIAKATQPELEVGRVGDGRDQGQPEPEGKRDGQEGGRLDAEESSGDLVTELIVFGAAASVDEEIAQQEATEEGRRQSPRTQANGLCGQVAQPLDGTTRLAVGSEGELDQDLVLAGDPEIDFPPAPPGQKPAAPRIATAPNPEWG